MAVKSKSRTVNAVILAVIFHVLVALVFIWGFNFQELASTNVTEQSAFESIQAVAVDQKEVENQLALMRQEERQKEQDRAKQAQDLAEQERKLAEVKRNKVEEEKRVAALNVKKQKEKKQLEKLKKEQVAEQQRIEKLKVEQELEQKKIKAMKAEQEAARKKEEQKQQAQAARRKQEEADRLAREKADQERKQRLEKELQEQLMQDQELLAQLEAQQVQKKAERSAFVSREKTRFASELDRQVSQHFVKPREASGSFSERECIVDIQLSPAGDVMQAKIFKSSGYELFDQAVMNAIYQASPFATPKDPEVFSQFRQFKFRFTR